MADPTKPEIDYSYTGFQQEQQDHPFPGSFLDNDLAELKRGIDDTIDALKDVRRADGKLRNGIVTTDSLGFDVAEIGEAMNPSIYDPGEVASDVFAMDNMVEGADTKILTASERSSIASALQPSARIDDDTFATATAENIPSAESVKAFVDSRVLDVRSFGIVADGSTDQTSALTSLFSTLSGANFRGWLHIPYNTKFDIHTVYAAAATTTGMVIRDRSSINWGQPPGYKNKFDIIVTGDEIDDDSQVVNISGHHPANMRINLGNAGTPASAGRWISDLFAVGIDPRNDPILGVIHQFKYDSVSDAWMISERLQTPPDIAMGDLSMWAASTAVTAGQFLLTPGAGRVYEVTVGGTTGSSEPTHTSGTAADGTATVLFRQASLNIDSTRHQRLSNGDLMQFGPADHVVKHEMTSGGRTHSFRINGTTNDITWRDDSRRRSNIVVTDGNGMYLQAPTSKNFRPASGATPTITGHAMLLTQTGATNVTGFTLPSGQSQGWLCVMFGDGNSTLKASSINLKGGVDVTPTTGQYMEFVRVTTISSSWREISRSF